MAVVRSAFWPLSKIAFSCLHSFTYDFSSCFFPKFKKSTKRGFSLEMPYFFGFYGPKIGGGGPSTRILSTNIKNLEMSAYFGVFLPPLGWSCRTVLHTPWPPLPVVDR